MLTKITSESEIKACQSQLETILISNLKDTETYLIGYPSGSKTLQVFSNSNIWFAHSSAGKNNKRYWNAFGLSKNLSKKKSNSIVTEVNILKKGINGQIAGAFAKDDKTNKVYLTHSGKVGGGKKGIGKKSFLSWYESPTQELINKPQKPNQAIIIGDISSKSIIQNLINFVNNVENFKKLVSNGDINEVTVLTDTELEEKIQNILPTKKRTKKNNSSGYQRNQYISELVKRKAQGNCQLCNEKAPFFNKLGKPYLESHHIVWLSKGGDDSVNNSVAVCPNCHKKLHILNLQSDITTLLNTKNT